MMNSSAFTTISILLALVALFSVPSIVTGQLLVDSNVTESVETDVPTESCQSITDILCADTANLKALCEAISISGLNDDLDEDAWTIFAPTDNAFEALGRDNLDSLVFGNDTVPLTDLLLFHIVPGVSLTSDLLPCEAGNNLLEMANGEDSRTLCANKVTPIQQRGIANERAEDSPNFTEMDIIACNGVIHIMDKVLLYQPLPFAIPEGRPESDSESPLQTEVTATPILEIESTNAPTIVIIESTSAPTEPGTDGTTTVTTITNTLDDDIVDEESECQTIAEIACSNSDFSTLCALLFENGLADDLGSGTWTVFAPMNSAFNDIRFPSDTDIGFVLLGHVIVDASIRSEDLVCTERIEMANGKDTRTVCKNGATYQKGKHNSDEERPQIVTTDIEACNGIIHVVDQVILS